MREIRGPVVIICFQRSHKKFAATDLESDSKVQTDVTRWLITQDTDFCQQGTDELVARHDECLRYGWIA